MLRNCDPTAENRASACGCGIRAVKTGQSPWSAQRTLRSNSPVRAEEVVCQIPVIPDDHPAVPEDRQRHRAAKLARPFTRSTERTAKFAIRADNGDEGGLDVEDVQLTRAVEPNLVDVPEQLPILAG